MSAPNHPNPSTTGLGPSGTSDSAKTKAGTTEGVWSGPTGMDQSVRMGSEAQSGPTNRGNCCPTLPPIKHGN